MSKSSDIKLIKPIKLVIQVIVFRVFLYLLGVIKNNNFLFDNFLEALIPRNYFVILYISLYLISPILNMFLSKLAEENKQKKVMILLFLVFSVYPTCIDTLGLIFKVDTNGLSSIGLYGSQWGYSIVNFILMYLLGAISNNKIQYSQFRRLVLAFVLLCLDSIWAYADGLWGYVQERSAWEYCNPLLITISFLIFGLFKELDIKPNKPINSLAQGALTVYLMHTLFFKYIHIEKYVSGNWILMLVHMIISILGIYSICWGVHKVYEFIFRPIDNILKKVEPINKKFWNEERELLNED